MDLMDWKAIAEIVKKEFPAIQLAKPLAKYFKKQDAINNEHMALNFRFNEKDFLEWCGVK